FFLCIEPAYSQYFTSSGPTTVTIPFGQQSAQATFYFTYNLNGTNMVLPKLAIFVDGELIAGALCQGLDPFTPSSYTITISPGNHIIKFVLNSLGEYEPCHDSAIKWQQTEHYVNTNFKIRLENNPPGGIINVDNVERTSPYDRTATPGDVFAIGAIDQTYGGNDLVWNSSGVNKSMWQKQSFNSNPNFYTYDRNTTYSVQSSDQSTTLIANLRILYNLTFTNQLTGSGQNGTIKINGNTVPAPATSGVVEQNNISVAAQYTYDFGGSLFYEFSNWSDGPTQVSRSITASQTQNYTAVYKRIPKFSEGLYRNLTLTFPGRGNLKLSWNEHPDTNVTHYQIWQMIKKINGVNQLLVPSLVTTVQRGTTSYIHPNFQQLPGEDQCEVYFDVRAYYAPDATTSWEEWILVTAWSMEEQNKKSAEEVTSQIIKEYSISNYPNPFNPTTNIEYAIKEDGFVTIKVYDILGNEVAELVNEQKTVGRYTTEFNAASAAGLPSGVYLYSIQVNNAKGGSTFLSTKKMILAK
ncbi:MAG TPA: T9SS type A sorting domain-containing protein, partial [Bacteroidia bacterium]|nr:T9SS type A sorting domain-containing protein [Bacteroidia bacterium]